MRKNNYSHANARLIINTDTLVLKFYNCASSRIHLRTASNSHVPSKNTHTRACIRNTSYSYIGRASSRTSSF